LLLNDESLTGYSSLYKVMPPLRSEQDRLALIAGLKDGTIDCIASHHCPQEWDAKAKEFEYAGAGMNIQEIAFPIVWQAVSPTIGLERLMEIMSKNPRTIFGLPPATIAAGAAADITLYSTEKSTILNAENICSLSRNNPFMGKQLAGSIAGIIHNGQTFLNQ
jgi:dihydroorotase